ncbi:MAG: hypothetical protein R2751_12920 [Bacteroidales bacterium]
MTKEKKGKRGASDEVNRPVENLDLQERALKKIIDALKKSRK